MKAMILAAGGGTRLYPLTFSLPKPMAPLLNRPVMEHIIRHISSHDFRQIIINLHNLPHYIENYFKDGENLGVNIQYSHETRLLGTAGGVKKVSRFFNDTFLVIGGDDLTNINLTEMMDFHKKNRALATIGLTYEEDVHEYGVVITDENGRIVDFQEKPEKERAKSHWVNNGIYIFEPEIFDEIPEKTVYDFGSQLFPKLKDKKAPFYGYRCKGYWKDIGNLLEYRKAHFDCLEKRVEIKFPGTEIMPDVWVEGDTALPADIKISGPVVIGKQCEFGKNVTLKGPLVMGRYNRIEDESKIIKTIMWNCNHIKENVNLIDCIVGSECLVLEGESYEEAVLGSHMNHVFRDYFKKKKMKVTQI